MHQVEDRDGLRVLVVSDMQKHFHPQTGEELPSRKLNTTIVHGKDIAEYYGIPYRTIIGADPVRDYVKGVWELIFDNEIGLRVNYNSEMTDKDTIEAMTWVNDKRNSDGMVISKKLERKQFRVSRETDDGMYVRYDDLMEYVAAQGWTKGGGRPKKDAPVASDQGSIVASVTAAVVATLQAMGIVPQAQAQAQPVVEPKPKRVMSDEQKAKMAAGRAAARAAKADA